MLLNFYKYQGTGNDFVIIDNRSLIFPQQQELISRLCDRRFGIGADGLMLLQNYEGYDFEMVYFNADGRTSSMCGNGGRCITAFAKALGIIEEKSKFIAIDGEHQSKVLDSWIGLELCDVSIIREEGDDLWLDTGSPHHVRFVKDVSKVNVYEEGRKVRNSPQYINEGVNVNFVQVYDNYIQVRTYERGVEDETYSCGTGVTAGVLAAVWKGLVRDEGSVDVETKGGRLRVRYNRNNASFDNIWLDGPAECVYKGEWEI